MLSYRRLLRRNIYPGIDLVFRTQEGHLEYDFLLAPHADPSRIVMTVSRHQSISIDDTGALVVATAEGILHHRKPVIFETLSDGSRRIVHGNFYLLGNNRIGFSRCPPRFCAAADDRPCARLLHLRVGGSGDDSVIAADNYGNMVGNTTSVDFPGAAPGRRPGGDIFITLAQGPSSSTTFVIGGSGNDIAMAASLNLNYYGTIFVGGSTNSTDFPTAINVGYNTQQPVVPWQQDYAGGATDGFYIQVTTTGNGVPVIFSSYLGGPGDDQVTGNQRRDHRRHHNRARLARPHSLSAVPVVMGPGGGIDGFCYGGFGFEIFHLYFSQLYFGGSGDDIPYAVASGSGGVYIAGETTSPDFSLLNPLFSQLNGASDAFLLHTNAGLTAPMQSTLFGGSGKDRVTAISAPGGAANIFVAGVTASPDFPVQNGFQNTFGGGASDAFLVQFSRRIFRRSFRPVFSADPGPIKQPPWEWIPLRKSVPRRMDRIARFSGPERAATEVRRSLRRRIFRAVRLHLHAYPKQFFRRQRE